jgi:uncharacterized protein
LRYKIKDIPPEGQLVDEPLARQLLADALDGMDADLDRTAGAARFQLVRNDDDVLVTGSVKATIGLACSACLQPARVDVSAPVKMVYRLEEEASEDSSDDDPLDEADMGVHDGKFVELDPMVRELLILSVPMTVRCKESCKGLCPVCGQDKNTSDCGHTAPELEGEQKRPFAALKDLKV